MSCNVRLNRHLLQRLNLLFGILELDDLYVLVAVEVVRRKRKTFQIKKNDGMFLRSS